MDDSLDRSTSVSSIGKLSSKLSRSRRNSRVENSDHSNSTDQDAAHAHSSKRRSVENTLGLLKPSSRRSSADHRPHDARRLSKILKIKSKRRKSGQSQGEPVAHSSSLLSVGDLSLRLKANGSSSSLHSSLMTDDSEHDSQVARPALASHDSHSGYLTISSPHINAQTTLPDTAPVAVQDSRFDALISNSPPSPSVSPHHLATEPASPGHDISASAQKESAREGNSPLGVTNAEPDHRASPLSSSGRKAPQPVKISPIRKKGPLPEPPDTPSTFITPPTPTLRSSKEFAKVTPTKLGSPSSALAASPVTRSVNTFAALSPKQTLSLGKAPLTPHVEETKTPGGSLISPTSGGFFSSVFSAAQNAATQLSNPFAQSQKQKSPLWVKEPVTRGRTGQDQDAGEESIGPFDSPLNHGSQSTEMPDLSDVKSDDAAHLPALQQLRDDTLARPKSVASAHSYSGEQSPSRLAQLEPSDIKRNGSIRSRLSDRRKGRKRGSSVATAGTYATGLPGHTNGHRPTGFAVASSKRNKDFHQLFRSVPEDDYLIEDYSAALQRDILLHGRFYVSEGHICFASNILGWVTNLVIAFDEIVCIEKKNTAIVFPNALVIKTHHSRNVFASFVARDSTFDLLLGIWRTTHPNLIVTSNSISLDAPIGHDKRDKGDSTESGSESGSESDVYDEDADYDDDLVSITENGGNGSIAGSETEVVVRKATMPIAPGTRANELSDTPIMPASTADFPGPASHEPTECNDTHYDRPLIDTTLPAPLGKIYDLWFGPASGPFMRSFLIADQKSRELVYDPDNHLSDSHRTFNYSYIKPLSAPVGPKQTKCLVTATLQSFDLSSAIVVDCATSTPDVPSGNIFVTRTRYCLMWGPSNSTRVIATCTIDWSGKSWLKGPIEKGANDGQIAYVKDLVAALKAGLSKSPTAGGKKKKRRRRSTVDTQTAEKAPPPPEADWGLWEPLRPALGWFGPAEAKTLLVVLLVLVLQSWWSSGRSTSVAQLRAQEASYERLWQREEGALWEWLERRTGADIPGLAVGANEERRKRIEALKRSYKDRGVEGKKGREALKVVGERVAALREVVGEL